MRHSLLAAAAAIAALALGATPAPAGDVSIGVGVGVGGLSIGVGGRGHYHGRHWRRPPHFRHHHRRYWRRHGPYVYGSYHLYSFGDPYVYKDDSVGYVVEPVPPVSKTPKEAAYCREFTREVVIDGETVQAYGRACRQEDGSWKIVGQE